MTMKKNRNILYIMLILCISIFCVTDNSDARIAFTNSSGYPTIVLSDASGDDDAGQGDLSYIGTLNDGLGATQYPIDPSDPDPGDTVFKDGTKVIAYFDVSAGSIYLDGTLEEEETNFSFTETPVFTFKDGNDTIAAFVKVGSYYNLYIPGIKRADKGINHMYGLHNPIFDPAGKTLEVDGGPDEIIEPLASFRDPTMFYHSGSGKFHIFFTLIRDVYDGNDLALDSNGKLKRNWEIAKVTTSDFRSFSDVKIVIPHQGADGFDGFGFASPDRVWEYTIDPGGPNERQGYYMGFQTYQPQNSIRFGYNSTKDRLYMALNDSDDDATDGVLNKWTGNSTLPSPKYHYLPDPAFRYSPLSHTTSSPHHPDYKPTWGSDERKIDVAWHEDDNAKLLMAYKQAEDPLARVGTHFSRFALFHDEELTPKVVVDLTKDYWLWEEKNLNYHVENAQIYRRRDEATATDNGYGFSFEGHSGNKREVFVAVTDSKDPDSTDNSKKWVNGNDDVWEIFSLFKNTTFDWCSEGQTAGYIMPEDSPTISSGGVTGINLPPLLIYHGETFGPTMPVTNDKREKGRAGLAFHDSTRESARPPIPLTSPIEYVPEIIGEGWWVFEW